MTITTNEYLPKTKITMTMTEVNTMVEKFNVTTFSKRAGFIKFKSDSLRYKIENDSVTFSVHNLITIFNGLHYHIHVNNKHISHEDNDKCFYENAFRILNEMFLNK